MVGVFVDEIDVEFWRGMEGGLLVVSLIEGVSREKRILEEATE